MSCICCLRGGRPRRSTRIRSGSTDCISGGGSNYGRSDSDNPRSRSCSPTTLTDQRRHNIRIVRINRRQTITTRCPRSRHSRTQTTRLLTIPIPPQQRRTLRRTLGQSTNTPSTTARAVSRRQQQIGSRSRKEDGDASGADVDFDGTRGVEDGALTGCCGSGATCETQKDATG